MFLYAIHSGALTKCLNYPQRRENFILPPLSSFSFSSMSFPLLKSWQCSFPITCDFLNLAFKTLQRRTPPKHLVIPSAPQHSWLTPTAAQAFYCPLPPAAHTLSPHTHSCRGQSDASVAPAINKFQMWFTAQCRDDLDHLYSDRIYFQILMINCD